MAHERICVKTRRLRQVVQDADTLATDPSEASEIVDFLCAALREHTSLEHGIIVESLQNLSKQDERQIVELLTSF